MADKLDEIEANRSKAGAVDKDGDGRVLSATGERKINLIRNYPIPNAREDLIELFTLAAANLTADHFNPEGGSSKSERALAEAWEAKLSQAHSKAQMLLAGDASLEKLEQIYKEKQAEIAYAKRGPFRSGLRSFAFFGLWIALMLLMPLLFKLI